MDTSSNPYDIVNRRALHREVLVEILKEDQYLELTRRLLELRAVTNWYYFDARDAKELIWEKLREDKALFESFLEAVAVFGIRLGMSECDYIISEYTKVMANLAGDENTDQEVIERLISQPVNISAGVWYGFVLVFMSVPLGDLYRPRNDGKS